MECKQARKHNMDDDHMVTCELEAAEALAGLAWNSTVHGGALDSERQSHGGKTTEISSFEAEKEARRCRRILANRESARKTIRRRQAMHAELISKAADLSVENGNLKKHLILVKFLMIACDNCWKKEKEMAVKEYDYLKNRNECLKAEVANIEVKASEIEEESKKLVQVSISTPTTTLIIPYNHPSTVPFLCPAIVPSSDNAFGIRGSSHSDIESSSQIPIPSRDSILRSFQDQEHATRINEQGTSLFVVPSPCFFPIHTPSTTQSTLHSHRSSSENVTSAENHRLILPQKMKSQASNSMEIIPTDHLTPTQLSYTKSSTSLGPSNSSQIAVSSAARSTTLDLSTKNQKPVVLSNKMLGYANMAAEARRRRKELMKLSNIHFHQKGTRGRIDETNK
ncbi:Basic-leucine zipper (bZIP) transcription factor family protein [Abeliophyllum distichum]|uniref:Basic-leucine zipper (BZIP) transcription factor family protein n=1 Tax=Abeliophyllum distichum TaxID=126358 RepID=A0ABD1RFL4_9LAMI